VLIVLAMGEFMILLDTTVVNVAIPNMSKDLHASLDQVLWVLNAYILTFAILLITAGRLGSMFGPKKLFLGGLFLFTAASIACSLAQTPNELIVFRVLQATGGAALTPQTLSIITSIFPPEKRGAAFGVWGAVYGLGGMSGPTLGGFLTSAFSWRAIFIPNVPIGVTAMVLAYLMMPELTVHRKHSLDIVGIILATATLFALIFALIEGQTYSWGRISNAASFDLGPIHAGLISIPSLFAASALFLLVFLVWEAKQEEPVLPLSLFGNRNFALGCVISAIQVFGMTGLFLPLSIFLQSALHLTPLQAGVTILPQALASVAVAPLVGRMADRVNAKYLLIAGLTLYSVGMGILIFLTSVSATGLTFTIPMLVIGVGVGLTFAPMVSLTMQGISPTASGAASGFMNTIRQVGSALGSALVGAILAIRLAAEQKSQAVHFAAQLPSQFRTSFVNGSSGASGGVQVGPTQATVNLSHNVPASLAPKLITLGQSVYSQAFVNAIRPALLLPLVLSLCGAALAVFTAQAKRGAAPAHGPMPEGVPPRPEERVAAAGVEGAPAARVPIFVGVNTLDTIVLPVSIPTRVQPGPRVRAVRPPFLLQTGDATRREHFIKNTLSIGRMPGNDLVLPDDQVSRRHADILRAADGYVVRDLHSANGTLVNGQRIGKDHPLHEGDTIVVGNTSFVYHNDFEIARPRLLRTSGNERSQHLIGTRLSIGRSPDNDISVSDGKISRHHAVASTDSGFVYLRDLSSLNGTRVNGELITGDHLLQDGDTVTVGDASFIYRNDFETANPP
jgi:EmrB/QacA subfamily drug resistance transporter